MTKRIVLTGLIILVATGCAGTIKRGVQGDTFYSTYPELAIKLAPQFKYVKKDMGNNFARNRGTETGSNSGSSFSTEKFEFEDRPTRKAGRIIISKLGGRHVRWNPDVTSGIKNVLSSGNETHQGARYRYAVYPVLNDDGSCYLTKITTRVAGGIGDTLLEILYFESLSDIPKECRKWEENLLSLDNNQSQRLEMFIENSARNMKFVDLAELKLKE